MKTTMVKTYDPKSFLLAEQFMFDVDCPRAEVQNKTQDLARHIQQAVENWMQRSETP